MFRATVVLLALVALPALAQEGLGLDLSEETKPQQEPPRAEQEESTAQPAPAVPVASPELDADRDVTQEDRVKSVQRKVFLKRGRFELAPSFAFSVNDPFYTKSGVNLRAGYFLGETLALAVRGGLWRTLINEEARSAKFTFGSQILPSRPLWSATAGLEWSPLYGKVAFLNSILHFDAYLLGGAGVVSTEASAREVVVQGVNTVRGPNPAVDLGVGMRFVARDFLAVNAALINTAFVDQPSGTTKGTTQNLMTLNVGISVFFPFTSTGRDAE